MEIFLEVDTWVALLTLTFMEIVLGIDNIIFISIVAGKLPEEQQKKARILETFPCPSYEDSLYYLVLPG